MKFARFDLPPLVADAVAQCRQHFLTAAVFSFLINLLYLAPAIYMLQIYDRVVPTAGKTTLLFVTIALGLALSALAVLDMVRNRLFIRVGERLDALVTPRILRHVMEADSATTRQAMRDFDSIRGAFSSPAFAALFDAPWIPLYLAVAFLLDFWLGILAVVGSVILVLLAWLNQRATGKIVEVATSSMASAYSAQQAAATHGSAVKALGMAGAMVERQLGHRRVALANMGKAQFAGGRLAAASRFARLFIQSVALGLGALLAIAGEISAGTIIASSVLISRALQPIEAIIGAWPSLASARAAAHRLSRSLENLGDERIRTALPPPKGNLDVTELGLRASDGRPILVGVTFSASPGMVLGIIGPSGSGKTTLGKLIVGALQPSVGAVRIDGARLPDWDQDELGRYIGYMPQEPALFEGTIKENIARFSSAHTELERARIDKEVVTAAKSAEIHELILQLPNGYDTTLGLMGTGLSAGQAQRIALARALFGEPSLLVLDEPNAFLDQVGEDALLGALDQARVRGATVVIIAHRRGLLETADRLLVLEGGRMKLIGPAAEVITRLTSATPAENDA